MPLVALLILALASPATATGHIIIEGPDSGGWITLIVESDFGVHFDLFSNVIGGPKKAYGGWHFDPLDPSERHLAQDADRGYGDWSLRVEADDAEIANQSASIVPGPTNDGVVFTDTILMGYVFYAAGDVESFNVEVFDGRVTYAATGPDAVAAYTQDFRPGGFTAQAHASVANVALEKHATSTFNLPRPFWGAIDHNFIWLQEAAVNPLGTISLISEDRVRQCPCELTPAETSAGQHEVHLNGLTGDRLVYWAVAPILPPSD